MPIILCVVGMPGAGKSIVSDELKKRNFSYLRFGQIILDQVKKEGLEINEINEKLIRERLRSEHGMAAMALLNISKIDEIIKSSNIVIDGLYSWSEYKLLKEKYGDIIKIIAVYASPEIRYSRLENRLKNNDEENRFRRYSKEDAQKRDYAEIENVEKGGPIAMADYTIINTKNISYLKKELNRIMLEINDFY